MTPCFPSPPQHYENIYMIDLEDISDDDLNDGNTHFELEPTAIANLFKHINGCNFCIGED